MKKYFDRKSKERYNFGHELKTEISAFGAKIDKGGSVAGTVHRAWMDIKAFLSVDNDASILEEALRGEKAALEEYNDVLSETALPQSTLTVLLKQKSAIDSDISTIKRLEDLK